MNDLVSVIVPIFNAEKYLDECIKSIINQTYINFELLLINDGSIDGSEQICLDWEKEDERIYYFYYENEGASAARNHGIEKSRGKYIMFVDADDKIRPSMLQKIYSIRNEGELCQCLYSNVWIEKHDKNFKSNFEKYNVDEALDGIFNVGKMNGFVWGKLFQTEIIKNNKINFHNEIKVCEDLLFCIEYLLNCKNFVLFKEELYFYRIQNESITRGENYFYKKTRLKAYKIIIEHLEKNHNNKKIIRKYKKLLKKNKIYVCLDYFKNCEKNRKIPEKIEIKDIFIESKIKNYNLVDFLLEIIFLNFSTYIYCYWKRIHNEKK